MDEFCCEQMEDTSEEADDVDIEHYHASEDDFESSFSDELSDVPSSGADVQLEVDESCGSDAEFEMLFRKSIDDMSVEELYATRDGLQDIQSNNAFDLDGYSKDQLHTLKDWADEMRDGNIDTEDSGDEPSRVLRLKR